MVAAVLRGLSSRLPPIRHDALPHPPSPLDGQAQPRGPPLSLPAPLPAVESWLRRHLTALGQGLSHEPVAAPARHLAFPRQQLARPLETGGAVDVEEQPVGIPERPQRLLVDQAPVELPD